MKVFSLTNYISDKIQFLASIYHRFQCLHSLVKRPVKIYFLCLSEIWQLKTQDWALIGRARKIEASDWLRGQLVRIRHQ